MIQPLINMEAILKERERLWDLSTYFQGASERDPNWSSSDEEEWDRLQVQEREQDRLLKEITAVLRSEHAAEFAVWVDARNRVREKETADPATPSWKHDHNRRTTELWNRYIEEDIQEIYLNRSW